ncbi:ParA family protein [uncultured Proteiniphilum sp.]|uniref:ParA family protein n=1 Tax=uncultured Proteiniphilum sp. TaxID=497637 RepID=UPI0026112595|nr:ParA family protein [uncultured Proteiniphilum sp.]
MRKEPLFVSFSTQKGGIGKTALTVLTASYLHFVKGFHVGVIDCDYPQHSLGEMRKRDNELVLNNDYFRELAIRQYMQLGVKTYPVEECTAEQALQRAEVMIQSSEILPEVIFFDLPGTLNSPGVIRTLAAMDYIFVPMNADRVVLESTLQYAVMLSDNLIKKNVGNLKAIYLFWNLVDGREKTLLYTAYEKVIGELGLNLLKTYLPDSKRFRKEVSDERKTVFRSTLFPVDKSLRKGSNIPELTDDICKILKLNHYDHE